MAYRNTTVDFTVNNIGTVYNGEDLNNEFKTHVWPVALVVGILTFIGIFGNIFVLYVHIFKYPLCNFRFFVLGLCAVDLTSSLTILPLEVFTQLSWYTFPYAWLCKLKAFFHVFLSVCSVYVLLLIAIDRYRKVCAPHDWQITTPFIVKGYLICFSVAIAQSFPVVIIWGIDKHKKTFRDQEVLVTVCGTDPTYRDSPWSKVFLGMMVPHVSAMVAMVVIYVFVARRIFGVVRTMRQKSERRRQYTSQIPKEDQLKEDDDVFMDNSDSVIDSKLREEIVEPLNCNKNVKMIAYKVCDTEIMFEKGNSLKRNEVNGKIKLKYDDIKTLKDRSEMLGLRKSESSVESYKPTEDSKERTRSRGYSTASTLHESTDNDYDLKEEPKPIESGFDTIKSVTKSIRRKSLFQKKVRFSTLARDKLKRRTLITFVFTAIYIITTITYICISGHVVNDNSHALHFGQLSLLLFFYRLYFINNVIHPIIYGVLDVRFRKTLRSTSKKLIGSVWRSHHEEHDKNKS